MPGKAAAYGEAVLGGVATICPECSYEWTISPAVSISWPCPKCGGSRCVQTDGNVCVCGHVYGEHNTFAKLPPSRAAFGVRITEMDMLADLLAIEPVPPPKLGDCTACTCERFELKPPTLSAGEFLRAIYLASTRGAGGREALARELPDGSLQLSKGGRSVELRAQPGECVAIAYDPADSALPRILPMDGASVGATVIALRGYLSGVQRAT